MWTISKRYDFEAGHWLPLVPEGHQCGRKHGHSYVLEVALEGDALTDGWLTDFGDISKVVKPVVAELDHRMLNDIDGLGNPTSEHLAKWFWDRISPELQHLRSITLRETVSSSCEYRGGQS